MNYVNQKLQRSFHWERYPKGEVGIEIEIEGGGYPEDPIQNWVPHPDGSLRNGGTEYVIRQPVLRDNVRAALDTLAEGLRNAPKVFSYRTSVHVHINVQDMSIRQWCAYLVLFAIFEELLVNVVGPERAGNKFCLRFKDADASLRAVASGVTEQNLPIQLQGDLKYASCNIRATLTHGTLEFRAMRGNLDPAFITDWVNVLMALKDHAKDVRDPTVFVGELSMLGAREFALKYLPRDNSITRAVLDNPIERLTDSMYEGVRLGQDVAFCTDWGEPIEDTIGPRRGKKADAPLPIDPFDAEMAAMGIAPAPALRRVRRVDFENVGQWIVNDAPFGDDA